MKILYATDSFALPTQPGAARSYQVAKWLRTQGHDVTVLCNARNKWNGEITFTGTWERPAFFEGIKIIGLPTPDGRHKSRIHRVRVYLSLLIHTYLAGRRLPAQDIVIAGTPPLLQPLAALHLARRYRASSIIEVRDLHPQMSVASGIVTNPFIIWPWGLFERALRRRFDHLVAAVPRIRSMVAEEGIESSKVTVITNGYDLESDGEVPLSPDAAAYFERNKGKFIIGYMGSMGRGALNVTGLVEAAKHLQQRPDIALLFVGNGEQRKKCIATARDHQLTSCTFLPPAPRLEVASMMRRCHALMIAYHPGRPFYEYIIPIKLIDYMGAGRAVLFGGKGDGADLLLSADGGIVIPHFNPKPFADAIIELADHPQRAAEMGRNNRQYVEKYLLRHHEFRKWDDVIRAVLKTPQAAPGNVLNAS